MLLDAAHHAALSAGKPLVYVCPPAGWAARPLFTALPPATARPATVVIVPDSADALDFAGALAHLPDLAPVHPATGPARADRLLRRGQVATLIATVRDTLDLVRRAALKLEGVTRLALAWPERTLGVGLGDPLDTLLAEAAAAQRIVLTEDEGALAEFLERHARRALVARAAPIPDAPTGSARYAVVDRGRRAWGVRAVLDVVNPEQAVIWDPAPDAAARWADLLDIPTLRLVHGTDAAGEPVVPAAAAASASLGSPTDLAIAVELPSADVLAGLRTQARSVVVLLRASQLPYLRRIAEGVDHLRLASSADQAREELQALRREVRERLTRGLPVAELFALDTLFDEHEPALVAAALLAAGGAPGRAAPAAGEVPSWIKIHVNAGRRDQIRPGDLVGALLNAVGLAKEDVGRIELKEGFALVDVRAQQAERAVSGLAGITLRGKRISARLDRR